MKSWYKSKTLWLNATMAAFATLEVSTGMLQPHLPFNLYFAITIILPAVNAMLRFISTSELTK